jgi:hypothetical protein
VRDGRAWILVYAGLALACTAPNPAYQPRPDDDAPPTASRNDAATAADGAVSSPPPADGAVSSPPPADSAAPFVNPGLLGYWPLDEAAGSTLAHDGSGQGRDGMVEGLAEGLAFVGGGHLDRALSFPGGSSAGIGVRVAYSTEIDELRAFTVTAWFKLASVPGVGMQRSVISRQLGNSNGEVFNLTCNAGDVVVYIPGPGGQINFEARAKLAAVAGVWTHAAATYDGRTLRLYVNGTQAPPSSFPDRLVSSVGTPVYIGTNKNTNNRSEPFHGLIDEVALYSYALSSEAIALLAAGTSPPDVR